MFVYLDLAIISHQNSTKMTESIFFTGKCPNCQRNRGLETEMVLNNKNFWECPKCNLQILIENNLASIFRHRGINDFKYSDHKFNNEIIFQEVDEQSYGNHILIIDNQHLSAYLKYSVEPEKLYSIDNLIESYVDFKFREKSNREYEYQSKFYKIDFQNEVILEKLSKKDEELNTNDQYSYKRLYSFLNHILQKYSMLDNSFLPEMGMSQIEFYLCRKHFPTNKNNLINSNPLFVKYAFKKILKDIIGVIYFDKNLILSYDFDELKKINEQMKTANI